MKRIRLFKYLNKYVWLAIQIFGEECSRWGEGGQPVQRETSVSRGGEQREEQEVRTQGPEYVAAWKPWWLLFGL